MKPSKLPTAGGFQPFLEKKAMSIFLAQKVVHRSLFIRGKSKVTVLYNLSWHPLLYHCALWRDRTAQRKRTTGPENQVKLPSEAYMVCCYLSLTHTPQFISLISHVTASHS